jgi:DNA adenine methylase
LLPQLSTFWADGYERYVEPFAGSACLFFYLAPRRALLGDINGRLIETLSLVKTDPGAVTAALRGLRRGKATYYRLRSIAPELLAPAQRAARFIYLNRFCFNGLYRTNRSGAFNVPYGGKRTGRLPSAEIVARCSSALRRAELRAADFEAVLGRVRPGDFVYLDPPFSVRAKRVFNEYDASIFGPEDVARLRSWLERLDAKGVAFLASYVASGEARYLARGFRTSTVTVRRSIAGFTGSRVLTQELLISNCTPRPKSETL